MSTARSQKTFSSLALTSKRFLPLARSRLYYRPISPFSAVSWEKALALVSSLSSPLGSLVVSLEGIVEFIMEVGNLPEPNSSLPFQLRGFTKTFSLYYEIIQSCTRLISVELIFNSIQHLSKLLKALEVSVSTLKTVKFANSTQSNSYEISSAEVREALRRHQLQKIDNLELCAISSDVSSSDEPSTRLALKSFTYKNDYGLFHAAKEFFPKDPSTLDSMTIEIVDFAPPHFVWLAAYLPLNIRHISIANVVPSWDTKASLQTYQRRVRPSIPEIELTRFTSLTSLSLVGFHGPSLSLIQSLATRALELRSIDFTNCKWINTSQSIATRLGDSIMNLVDPDDLLTQLLKFKMLRNARLGFLPTLNSRMYGVVEEVMREKRGVEIEWQVCLKGEWCNECFDWHY
jgi:hypothetical protein